MVHDLRILLAPPDIAVGHVWARASPAGARAGALYLTITSKQADQLIGVRVPRQVAAGAEMHTVDHDASGQLSMHAVRSFPLPAGAWMDFHPGAEHIMLLELAKPLVAGETFEVTLRLARAGNYMTRATGSCSRCAARDRHPARSRCRCSPAPAAPHATKWAPEPSEGRQDGL